MFPTITLEQYADRVHGVDPTHNPKVLENLLGLLTDRALQWTEAADLLYHPITLLGDSEMPVARNATDNASPFTCALADLVSHAPPPPEFAAWMEELPHADFVEFFTSNGADFYTDSMSLVQGTVLYPQSVANAERFTWMHSPVVSLIESDDVYLASLPSRYRAKLRRARAAYEGLHYVEANPSRDTVMQFVLPNLRARFKNTGFSHALRSFLMAWSATEAGVGRMYQFFADGRLVAIIYFIPHGQTMIYQGLVKDESIRQDNIGVALLDHVARDLRTRGYYTYLDVTAEAKPFDPPHPADQYKRAVVNTSAFLPVFSATFHEADLPGRVPYHDGVNHEYVTDGITFMEDKFPDLRSR